MEKSPTAAKNFFLNERQELSSIEREGGGRPAQYVPIDWSRRSADLQSSLTRAISRRPNPVDPSSARHYFVAAVPATSIDKTSTSKKAEKTGGIISQRPNFGGEHARLFRRLGMDFLEMLPGGRAVVHVPTANIPQIVSTIGTLPGASDRERFRWISLAGFEPLDWSTRVDARWLATIAPGTLSEVIIRFQPTLSRLEIQEILQAIAQRAGTQANARFMKVGRELSGRYWCSAFLTSEMINLVAREFVSTQSIHPPLRTPVAASRKVKGGSTSKGKVAAPTQSNTVPSGPLPIVAVVDTGIPEQHRELAAFRRSGYRNPDLDGDIPYMGDHGCAVASAIVFGRQDMTSGVLTSPGSCMVLDVMVSHDVNRIEDEQLMPALQAVAGTAPEVRVFNLSFDAPPLELLPELTQREYLLKLENLDNYAFQRDAILVIAAGNSPPGIVPAKPYPGHQDDPRWHLGAYARSFNGAVCGSYVDVTNPNAIAQVLGAPSPFTLVGPGLCDAPVPGFSAPGGDCLANYTWAPSTGVWINTSTGMWEDHCGTSVAAPLVAREAAWICQELARYCADGATPFAGTIKAWMRFSATRPSLKGAMSLLARRTLGEGQPSTQFLRSPSGEYACFVWQTVLQAPNGVSRVQFPVPLAWLREAKAPRLRIVVSWNTPVSSALTEHWAIRKVLAKVRPFGSNEAIRGGETAVGGYPMIDRSLDVSIAALSAKQFKPNDELWILECEYESLGPDPVGMTVSPQQRVGAILVLYDESESPVSPQPLIQAMPIAVEMDRLSVQAPLNAPILVKP